MRRLCLEAMAVDDKLVPVRPLAAFVGRERELTELRAAFATAAAGRGCLFLIAGEPGIGKTRLAEEAAGAVGIPAVWGRCSEGGGAPAYWPWIQVFRRLGSDIDPTALRDALGDSAATMACLAPDLVARAGCDPVPARPLESEDERFRLFDVATGVLCRLAEREPMVVVLDDLHAADEPSLLFLEFLARELRGSRLSVVGTYRELEARRDENRSRLLHAAARNGHRLPLVGLTLDEVGRLVRGTLGSGTDRSRADDLAGRLFRSTEGNPFFVDEMLRLIAAAPDSEAGDLRLPQGVRDAVRERFRPLSPGCRNVLTVAAVLGREFDLAILDAVVGAPGERAASLGAMGEAQAAGVVERMPDNVGRWTFAHALIQQTLYDQIAPADRARLHWKVAEVLAGQAAVVGDEPVAELAHHALHGLAVGDADKAVEYATRAGHHAASLLAHEVAASYFRQALDALALTNDGDLARRAEILLACAEAEAQAWNTDSAQVTFDRAAAVARELRQRDQSGAAELLARAALGHGRSGIGVPRGGRTDPTQVARLEEAIEALGSDQSALRARVLARLAVELYYSEASQRRSEVASEAARLARECGDVSTLAYVICAQHFAVWDSPDVERRLALANEAVRIAQRAGEQDTELVARLWRVLDVVEIGDFERWRRELDELETMARALRQPRSICFALTARAMRALWLSRFDEVEALGSEAVAIGQRAQDTAALVNYGLQRFEVLRARGAQEELLPEVGLWAQQMPDNPVVDCAHALLYADLGRLDEARRYFELIAADDFAPLRRVNGLCNVICWVAEACARIGDRDSALSLVAELRPRAGANLAFAPRILFGPGSHWLGLMVALRGDLDEAVELFSNSADRSRAAGGLASAAWSDLELSRVLVDRGALGDGERARDLLSRVGSVASEHGLVFLGSCAHEVSAECENRHATAAVGAGSAAVGATSMGGRVIRFPARTGARAVANPSIERVASYTLRREGDFWSASDGETTLRLKDSKGLRYIAQLLREPGREFHSLDLIATERAPIADAGASLVVARGTQRTDGMRATANPEVGDQMLDKQARAAYQRRLEDLREELEEATRFNDSGRAARAREEIDFIASELSRALGMGGRDRATGSAAERARVNVTRTVKAVIQRIARSDSNLGRYLETTIHTGTFCIYRPDPRIKVTWQLS